MVARDLGISETAAKKAYQRGYGDRGKVDLHRHLTGVQRAELGHAWDTLPRAANGGHDTACEEARRLIERMRHCRRAGITGTEIAEAIGVSGAYVSALMARQAEATPPR